MSKVKTGGIVGIRAGIIAFLIRTWVQKGLSFVSEWRGQCYFIGSYPLFFPFLLNDLHTVLVLLLVSITYRSTIVVQNVFCFFFCFFF